MSLRVERIASLAEVRDDWDRLAAGAGHVFATWEWISSWWAHMGQGRELYSFACRDEDGRTIAILPLYVAMRRPLRLARFIGYGDLNSPLCLAEDRPRAAAALRQVLGLGGKRCRLLLAENLPADAGWRGLLGGRLLFEKPDPVLETGGRSWEEFLASQSKRFRKRTRQQESRLERAFELNYRLAEPGDGLDRDIEALARLHHARWGEERSGLLDGPRGEAVRAALRLIAARGWLRLWLMELDGRTVAADLAFRWEGSEWAMNAGRDPDYDQHSVGAVLMAHAVRQAFEDGIETYRLLQGDDEYKLKWASEVRATQTMLVGPGWLVTLSARAVTRGRAIDVNRRARLRRFAS